MGSLVAFLLGILFGPRLLKGMDKKAPSPWTGETPPSPPKHTEHPPAPPDGWKAHPEPIPDRVRARAEELQGRLWTLGPGTRGGPEVEDWKRDGHPYSVLFRADEYQGQKVVGAYVEVEEAKPPTPATPPKQPPKPMPPGSWKAHPSPIPQQVVSTAWGLLPMLWAEGEGTFNIQRGTWKGVDKPAYTVMFRAETHAQGKKGVTAYVHPDFS